MNKNLHTLNQTSQKTKKLNLSLLHLQTLLNLITPKTNSQYQLRNWTSIKLHDHNFKIPIHLLMLSLLNNRQPLKTQCTCIR